MIAKLLAEALATLRAVADEIGVSLNDLTPEQVIRHGKDCARNGRFKHTKDTSKS